MKSKRSSQLPIGLAGLVSSRRELVVVAIQMGALISNEANFRLLDRGDSAAMTPIRR